MDYSLFHIKSGFGVNNRQEVEKNLHETFGAKFSPYKKKSLNFKRKRLTEVTIKMGGDFHEN